LKKNLIITLAVLVIAAMATSASAATVTYTGEYGATFTHSFSSGTEVFSPIKLAEAAYIKLNLTFKETDKIVAYLPLTIKPFAPAPTVAVGTKWYAAFNSSPVSFWASDNNSSNTYKFASLGDPLGIAYEISSGLVFNANGTVLGAGLNIYAADLGTTDVEVVIEEVAETVTVQNGNVFMGRITYGLPMDFTLGVLGVYTNGIEHAESDGTEAVIYDDSDYLTLGLDVVGTIPGLGAKLTAAIADSIEKETDGDYYTTVDHLAFQLKLEDINVGPVAAWAAFTGVGYNFDGSYRDADDDDAILNKYYGATAVEVEGTVDIPVGIPVKLTLGNGLWFEYPFTLDYNETYAEAVVEPLADLAITVSGAYAADLNDDYDGGWNVHGDVAYTVFGLTINPYIDYMVDVYADYSDDDVDFIVGLGLEGSPLQGLTLESDTYFVIEEKDLVAEAYAEFITEENFGLVKSAKTVAAGMLDLLVDFDYLDPDVTEPEPETDIDLTWHAYVGSEIGINDKLSAKIGGLYNDKANTIAASGKLTYAASDTITTNLILTYRQDAVGGYAGWMPFEFDDLYLEANVVSTIGKSTFKVAYGDDGLESAPTSGTHKSKPWNWLYNKPTSAMPWDKLSFTITVPF
jgi:hypothetical protein